MIMKKKILSIILAGICIFALTACAGIRGNNDGVSVYHNEDYHFKFYYPSAFRFTDLIENEEVDDECDITFDGGKHGEMLLTCRFNKQKNLHDYAKANNFLPENITSVTPSSFIYDMRNADKPYYLIVSATKRMVVTARYEYSDKDDEQKRNFCDSMAFEFTTYANVPRENRFLSDEIYMANGNFSLKIPANATYSLSPAPSGQIPEDIEKNENTTKYENANCTDIDVLAKYYYAHYRIVDASLSEFGNPLSTADADKVNASIISSLANNKISDIKITQAKLINPAEDNAYIYVSYTCKYNGKDGYGAYISGYNGKQFYEYCYVCQNDAPNGEKTQFEDLLSNAEFSKQEKG